ncbi:type VII secretion protein EssB [Sporosarcina sp. 179-K 3D1 HS]|uniref:type VII secretion protein EssB n=1 Tax=Sporosarcina sp. 179-K 3D1 HS TaxID=3232169 RepID=UPI0039A13F4D
MSKKISSYFESIVDTEFLREDNQIIMAFQRERIGLKNQAVVEFLREVDSDIPKVIRTTEDELIITATIPPTFRTFDTLRKEDMKTRWIFAHQLIEKAEGHPHDRLTLVVCPDNIVYNTGMKPFFIHYGVMDGLPPSEKDPDRVWLETKASVASAIDGSKTFDEYIKYADALNLSETESAILSATNPHELKTYCKEQIESLEQQEKLYVQIPKKKWKTWKITAFALGVLLTPALIFLFHYFIYEKPTNEAYLSSHQQFLSHRYSEVVTILEPQSVKKMPYVVLYEAAYSYVTNERLDEEQKRNVLSNITLQTDADYLKYWIHIGRADAEQAVDLARSMEDGELIVYGLLKRREEILAEKELTGEEKQRLLEEIDREVEEYEKLMEQEAESQQQLETEQNKPSVDEKPEVTQPAKEDPPSKAPTPADEKPSEDKTKPAEEKTAPVKEKEATPPKE